MMLLQQLLNCSQRTAHSWRPPHLSTGKDKLRACSASACPLWTVTGCPTAHHMSDQGPTPSILTSLHALNTNPGHEMTTLAAGLQPA